MTRPLMFALLFVFLAAPAAHANEAVDRTKALVAAFMKVKTTGEESKLDPAHLEANKAAFAELDAFLAKGPLTTEPIAPHKAQLDAAQQKKFGELFWQLLRLVGYPDSGGFFAKAKYELKPKGADGDVQMDATLVEEDIETEVVFHWRKHDGALHLVDVSFDGASLVKDYQNQFGRILKKKGGAGLLELLEKRLADEKKNRGAFE